MGSCVRARRLSGVRKGNEGVARGDDQGCGGFGIENSDGSGRDPKFESFHGSGDRALRSGETAVAGLVRVSLFSSDLLGLGNFDQHGVFRIFVKSAAIECDHFPDELIERLERIIAFEVGFMEDSPNLSLFVWR